jgi:lipoic acid synthetase
MATTFTKKRIDLEGTSHLKKMLRVGGLHTVCESALCPNIGECFAKKTATFLICGDVCTRSCAFCGVTKGKPEPLDAGEPERIARAVASMGLGYIVITSVTRDDLADGGASHFARCIEAVRASNPVVKVEVLVPDFKGEQAPAETVFKSRPDVFSHNVETVPGLYAKARQGADYARSLELLRRAADSGLTVKSGLMLGLGETGGDVLSVIKDLVSCGCSILTIGQYLAPGKHNLPVERYYNADEFASFRKSALSMGFAECASGTYVRSSYLAEDSYNVLKKKNIR